MLLTPTFVGLLLAGAHDRAIETPFLRAIVRSDPLRLAIGISAGSPNELLRRSRFCTFLLLFIQRRRP
jgi:hypothetical protein